MAASSESYETLFQKARDLTPRSLPPGAWYIIVVGSSNRFATYVERTSLIKVAS